MIICCIYIKENQNNFIKGNGVSTQHIGDMRNRNIYVSIDVEMDLALEMKEFTAFLSEKYFVSVEKKKLEFSMMFSKKNSRNIYSNFVIVQFRLKIREILYTQ